MIVGVGIDVVEIERIDDIVQRRGDGFLSRMFTDREIDYCRRHSSAAAHFAGRFAVKEAAMKALGVGWGVDAGWLDLEVVNDGRGKPMLRLSGSAARTAGKLGTERVHVSLSHSRETACAVVLLEGR